MAPTENYSPNWHVRCVSVPGPDTDLTLHVAFDNARFMFGCGEGTQRAYVQKRLSMKGLEGIFLLNAENRTRMGLPGVLLTAADGGIPAVDVIGPPDTSHFISTFRSSVMREHFIVNSRPVSIGKTPHDVTQVFQSGNVTVKAVSLVPPSLRSPSPSETSPIDLKTYRPDFASVRPTTMPRPELEAWRDLVVRHMFDRLNRADIRDQPKGPFVRPDGSFCASWPEVRYPLPLPTAEEQATDMVYILEPPPVRGKFDVKRAAELGVPNGPIRGKLVKGEDIEVRDPKTGEKRIVRPSDCLVGGGPGAVLIVVSCSPANLPSLLESTAFKPYQMSAGAEERRKVHLVVHRVTSAVWRDSGYQAWMRSFGETTQHFIADPEDYSNDTYYRSAAWNMIDLSMIDESIFKKPFDTQTSESRFELSPLPDNARRLAPNDQVRMHPPALADVIPFHDKDKAIPPSNSPTGLTVKQYSAATPEIKTVLGAAHSAVAAAKSARKSRTNTEAIPGGDIVVTTLGTGSAIPSKYRNVSATLLHIPKMVNGETGVVLLDCGEGTLGQTRRRFGPTKMRELYADLKMIFISHMHADHHLGLHSILEDRFKHGVTSPLYILAPINIGLGLQESASWQAGASDEALSNIVFVTSQRMKSRQFAPKHVDSPPVSPASMPSEFRERLESEGPPYEWGQEDLFNAARRWPLADCMGSTDAVNRALWKSVDKMLLDLDLSWMHVPQVLHRGQAFGLVLKHRSGWQVVYSGDTRPNDNLIKAGKGATLLIHEATLEDDKPEMAAKKGHSTFSQAIQVGRDMQARHILLNHFSQRYPKVPKLPTATPSSPSSKTEPVVSISFDLMSIRVDEMWKMAHYMEPISHLFPDEEEDGDNTEEAVAKDVNKSTAEEAEGMEKKLKKGENHEGHGRKKRKLALSGPGSPKTDGEGGSPVKSAKQIKREQQKNQAKMKAAKGQKKDEASSYPDGPMSLPGIKISSGGGGGDLSEGDTKTAKSSGNDEEVIQNGAVEKQDAEDLDDTETVGDAGHDHDVSVSTATEKDLAETSKDEGKDMEILGEATETGEKTKNSSAEEGSAFTTE